MRIEGPGSQTLQPSVNPQGHQPQAGAWKGEGLHVMDTSRSVLENGAEEITMGHSEKAESKRLQERKGGPETRTDVERIEQIMKYLETMHGENSRQKLEETAQRILSGRRDGASPREEARRAFGDVTDQFAALSYALARGEEQGAPAEQLDAIRDALADLADDFGARIQAGLAAEAGIRDLANGPEGAGQFRDTYRDVVLGHQELGKTFDMVVERHGLQDFPRVVPALIKSLGEDLSAVRPSREPERLQAILQDLYNLEVAVTVLEQAKELCAKLGGTPAHG